MKIEESFSKSASDAPWPALVVISTAEREWQNELLK
jgi:hypothetical protein